MVREIILATVVGAVLAGCADRPFIDMCPTSALSVKVSDTLSVEPSVRLVAFLPSCKSCSAEDKTWQTFVRRKDHATTVLVTPDSRADLEAFLGTKISKASVVGPRTVLAGHPQIQNLGMAPGNYTQCVATVEKGTVTKVGGFQ